MIQTAHMAAILVLLTACAEGKYKRDGGSAEIPDGSGNAPIDSGALVPQTDGAQPAIDASIVTAVVINEFVANHVGADADEFIEILAPPSSTLSDLTVLVVEGDGLGGPGLVEYHATLTSSDSSGFWTTSVMNNVIENGTMTLLLVADYTGASNTDLDEDDDGVLDNQPWSAIVDSVAVADGDQGDMTYSPALLTPNIDGVGFAVGGASRIPNGADQDAPGDWVRNDFDGHGLPCCAGAQASPGEAVNTPGAANAVM